MTERRLALLIGALSLTIAACGGASDNPSADSPVTALPKTSESITTTTTTSVAWEIHKTTRAALVNCLDELTAPALLREDMAAYSDTRAIDIVQAKCSEAETQLDVEEAPPGTNPLNELNLQVSRINLALSFGAVKALSGNAAGIDAVAFDDVLTAARDRANAALNLVG